MNKYRNVRTAIETSDAPLVFDSKHEARRYQELSLLVLAGEITDLEWQVKYPLTVNGCKVATYIADFRYRTKNGETVVEDAKGVKTQVYRLKYKLMKALYNITIQEV